MGAEKNKQKADKYCKSLFRGCQCGQVTELNNMNAKGSTIPTLLMMDAEYDPVRITFTCDGCIVVHSMGNNYLMFTPSQLTMIAEAAKDAKVMWSTIPNDDD